VESSGASTAQPPTSSSLLISLAMSVSFCSSYKMSHRIIALKPRRTNERPPKPPNRPTLSSTRSKFLYRSLPQCWSTRRLRVRRHPWATRAAKTKTITKTRNANKARSTTYSPTKKPFHVFVHAQLKQPPTQRNTTKMLSIKHCKTR
jgi:hypothetical protein